MSFERIYLQFADNDWNAIISKTVNVLRTGGIVVVPTETVYGLACRLNDVRAIDKLIRLKGRKENHPFALAFSHTESINDFVGEMSPLAHRLARRCLPGPVSLVINVSYESPLKQLPKEIRHAVSFQSSVCCRVPDHPLLTAILEELDEPIVLTSANKSGQRECISTEEITTELGSGIDLLFDEGSLTAPKPSTIVKIIGNDYNVLREGVLSAETIKRLSATMILFVCGRNLNLSPMAEAICEQVLSERFHCSVESLDQYGIVVLSAGLSAIAKQSANTKAIEVMHDWNIDLTAHYSQRLEAMHVHFADYIFTMTRQQREQILSSWQSVDSRLNVLRTDGRDIADPPEGSLEIFRECAEQIRIAINQRIKTIFP